MSEYD